MRVNGTVHTSFSGSLAVTGVGGGFKECVLIFQMGDTRAWLYAGGDYSQRQGKTDEEEGEKHEEAESLGRQKGKDLEIKIKSKKIGMGVGRFVNLKMGSSGISTQVAKSSAE